jgi:hypothetical protein
MNKIFIQLRLSVSIKIQNCLQLHLVVQTYERGFTRCIILLYQEILHQAIILSLSNAEAKSWQLQLKDYCDVEAVATR